MMKKFLFSLLLVFGAVAVAMAAKSDGVTFEKTRIDFGNVSSKGGLVEMDYVFTNNGPAPVSIVTVTNGGCHCTKPQFPKEPIAPGKSGTIVIKFDPRSYRGEVNRSVKVQFSDKSKRMKLTFTGVVIP
ncbi:MAG: DUF1573 domain-containing protein [Duncaniella sp.]|nr:DUF1573 domain-containing protein [Duncaniella sp.]MDE6359134.1 DUF1573 domain-containing protein [Duncaniella sp.]MDE6465447.1 DUF1573 domain-containing protein [Duncaniella sp.]MDE6572444.1 DUF1573 domain-containing protein [Duncaniella sp.]